MTLGSLTRAEDFKRLLRAGTSARVGGASITAVPGEADRPRLGLAVRAPRAVDRNRIKRRLRAACREALGGSETPVDVVVRADASAASISFQDLVNTFRKALA